MSPVVSNKTYSIRLRVGSQWTKEPPTEAEDGSIEIIS